MPVASLHMDGFEPHAPKQVFAPKEASAKGWWNATRKAYIELPLWIDMKGRPGFTTTINEDVIHFRWERNDLFISRKRNLR